MKKQVKDQMEQAVRLACRLTLDQLLFLMGLCRQTADDTTFLWSAVEGHFDADGNPLTTIEDAVLLPMFDLEQLLMQRQMIEQGLVEIRPEDGCLRVSSLGSRVVGVTEGLLQTMMHDLSPEPPTPRPTRERKATPASA